jgi:hypothetical protein
MYSKSGKHIICITYVSVKQNVKEHERNLQEEVAENEQVETVLHGQIEVLESDMKKLESALLDEREYNEKYLQGTEKVEAAH